MPCHSVSHLIALYSLGWKQNHLMLATLKLVPRSQSFYHILSRFLTPYHNLSPRLERNHFQLATLKLVPRALISYHILSPLVTAYHTLAHLILRLETKPFDVGNF